MQTIRFAIASTYSARDKYDLVEPDGELIEEWLQHDHHQFRELLFSKNLPSWCFSSFVRFVYVYTITIIY
jgi:hypothetical protein